MHSSGLWHSLLYPRQIISISANQSTNCATGETAKPEQSTLFVRSLVQTNVDAGLIHARLAARLQLAFAILSNSESAIQRRFSVFRTDTGTRWGWFGLEIRLNGRKSSVKAMGTANVVFFQRQELTSRGRLVKLVNRDYEVKP